MLSKLKIIAFSDKDLFSYLGEYSLQINPESFTHSHATTFSQDAGTDTAGTVLKFATHPPQDVRFDFILDGTGVVPGVRSVAKEIRKIKELVYRYNGKIHSPNYLKLVWGGLVFKCMLLDLDIVHQLFDPSGQPLRAKLSAAFRQHETPQVLARLADKKSADLTHVETSTAGTTLPLMAFRVYDRSDLHVHVARANDLNDLVHLTEGAQIRFPPAEE